MHVSSSTLPKVKTKDSIKVDKYYFYNHSAIFNKKLHISTKIKSSFAVKKKVRSGKDVPGSVRMDRQRAKLRVRNTCWRRGARASFVHVKYICTCPASPARATHSPGLVNDNSDEESKNERER